MTVSNYPKRLALFDIDGTLINTNGVGGRAMLSSLEAIYNQPFSTKGVPFGGRTDRGIIRDLLATNDVQVPDLEAALQSVFALFPTHLEMAAVHGKPLELPGIQRLLSALRSRPDIGVGLVTGNILTGARTKLLLTGIDPDQFKFGAFGDDSANRNDLPPLALERAAAFYGKPFLPLDAVIIGDTPADVECAHKNQITALIVETGWQTHETLAACSPDYLLPDLSDTDYVISILAGEN